jgi:hypothetical protein
VPLDCVEIDDLAPWNESIVTQDLADRTAAMLTSLRAQPPAERVPYREMPAPSAFELVRVVDEGTSPPSARAAAAVLLRRQGDKLGRLRLRVAAEATADPDLKRVFRVASQDEPDDAALEEAFEAVEQGARIRRAGA